jgi:hypothetical protein
VLRPTSRENGQGPDETQGGARVPFSGRPIARKVVCRSRDRGCNGHRILRRVPNDGRHPGSGRGVGFHEQAQSMVSAVFAPSDPYQPVKTRTCGQDMQHRGSSVEREGERGLRQGCQRLDRSQCRGKKTPTLVSPAREGLELEVSTECRSAEAVSSVVKHSVPRSCRTEP